VVCRRSGSPVADACVSLAATVAGLVLAQTLLLLIPWLAGRGPSTARPTRWEFGSRSHRACGPSGAVLLPLPTGDPPDFVVEVSYDREWQPPEGSSRSLRLADYPGPGPIKEAMFARHRVRHPRRSGAARRGAGRGDRRGTDRR
jgi:hypothetical protein